jgi:hypothetical protein
MEQQKWTERTLTKLANYLYDPLHHWKPVIDFSSEKLAKSIDASGDHKQSLIEQTFKRRNDLEKTNNKIRSLNILAITIIFISTYEKDLLVRIFGISVSGLNSIYELLLLLSSILTSVLFPISIHQLCLDRSLKYYFTFHEKAEKSALSIMYGESTSILSNIVMERRGNHEFNRQLITKLAFLSSIVLVMLAFAILFAAIHWVAIFHILENSSWPRPWVYALISWVAFVDILAFVGVVYLFIPLRYVDWDAVDRLHSSKQQSRTIYLRELAQLVREKESVRKLKKRANIF